MGTSDYPAQGIPEVVSIGIAGASGHGTDKAAVGRVVGGQGMQVSVSTVGLGLYRNIALTGSGIGTIVQESPQRSIVPE